MNANVAKLIYLQERLESADQLCAMTERILLLTLDSGSPQAITAATRQHKRAQAMYAARHECYENFLYGVDNPAEV